MLTVLSLDDLSAALSVLRSRGRPLAFVPTMGALHHGHAALISGAARGDTAVVVSRFVNPTQFGPDEDFERYPRTPEADAEIASAAGADVLWSPDTSALYPPGEGTRVSAGPLAQPMEGVHRPGHFDGVATVVVKLVNAVRPDLLVLGEKDWQQVLVIRQVLRDLLMPAEIMVWPVVREEDGLAVSSRNRYLSDTERQDARTLSRALEAAASMVQNGETNGAQVVEAMRSVLHGTPSVELEYAVVANPDTLRPVQRIDGPVRGFIAARVGKTRLIDTRDLQK